MKEAEGHIFLILKPKKRGEDPRAWRYKTYEYNQSHLPVIEQRKAVGHAVRACYMYSSMIDIYKENGDARLFSACKALWNDIFKRKIYITGGIGSSKENEGFTFDYDLPQEEAYAETCAAIGFMLFSSRMGSTEIKGQYFDAFETTLYNALLSGLSISGDRFFYSSPLAVFDPGTKEETDVWDGITRHRLGWFGCACCPPNIARTPASISQYAILHDSKNSFWLNLFFDLDGDIPFINEVVKIRVKTKYPYNGRIEVSIKTTSKEDINFYVRIPSWVKNYRIRLPNNKEKTFKDIPKNGYYKIKLKGKLSYRIFLDFDMNPNLIFSNPLARHYDGMVAVKRGPIVYCLENADNPIYPLERIFLTPNSKIKETKIKGFPGSPIVLKINGKYISETNSKLLYHEKLPKSKNKTLIAVPFYLWDNRKKGSMRVWLNFNFY